MMITTTIISAALLALSGVNAAPALELSLSGADSVRDVDNFSIVAKVTNTGDQALKLYKTPFSALSSFPANTFTVTASDGNTAKFVGAKVKYSLSTATNFVTLAPGASVEVTHDLSSAYNFTKVGDYEVEASTSFYYQDSTGAAVPIQASLASVHSAKLSGSLLSSTIARRSTNLVKRASFKSCSSSQQSSINTALTTTTSYLSNAVSYLNGISASTTRYKTWFGTYSATRKSTVLSHYQKIQSSDPKTYTYDCSCTDDVYAYVYPGTFGYVYLCDIFWSAPTSGTDSKAGTIVHEASHFTANGGTQDYAYGQSAAKSLATSNPARAIMNADNHEYFAENTPALS